MSYLGKVVRIMTFGAFIELTPGKDGMLHISKMADRPRGEGGRCGQHRRRDRGQGQRDRLARVA